MNKLIVFSTFLVFVLGISCEQTMDPEKEKELIISINEEERDAFFDRDISRLKAIWIQESSSKRYFSGERLTVLNGWNEIRDNYESSIDDDMWNNSEDLFAQFSNYDINVYNNTALVYHDIEWTGKMDGEDILFKQKRIAHFVKVKGDWKFDFTVQITAPSDSQDMD